MTIYYSVLGILFAAQIAFLLFFLHVCRSGKLFEWMTAFFLRRLDKRFFRVFNDILLPDGEGGTTQVDHLVVCSGGLFLVESKGWGMSRFSVEKCKLYASTEAATWKIYYKGKRGRNEGSATVPNPFRQNHKHHLCLSQALDIPLEAIRPMVCLPAFVKLMKAAEVPGLYLSPRDLVAAIREQAHGKRFTKEKFQEILVALAAFKQASGRKAQREHVQRLHEKYHSDICPRCGAPLVERTAKKTGMAFVGCSRYPACRYTRQER